MTTKGKVLVLVSSGHGLPLKDGKVYTGAGYYLNELTVPVRALMKEGYEITFANPKGNTPQMDVHSAVADFFGGDEAKLQDYLKFRDTLTGLKNPTRISDVIASGLDQYDAVFVPGGHGPMMDLLDDPDAGTVLRHFHNTSKPTAALCHGPISLLAALPNSTEVVAALSVGDAAGARANLERFPLLLFRCRKDSHLISRIDPALSLCVCSSGNRLRLVVKFSSTRTSPCVLRAVT